MAARASRIALSFSGSGHLHAYQLGAAHHLLTGSHAWAGRFDVFAGSSGGAIAATVCALLPAERLSEFARTVSCKGFGFNGLTEALIGRPSGGGGSSSSSSKFVFTDSQVRAVSEAQTLYLSATHCRTGRNVLFSRFRSAAELQRCVFASAAIPKSFHPLDLYRNRPTYPEALGVIVSDQCLDNRDATLADEGLPFHPDGEAYVDGGITNTAPLLHDVCNVHTLTISPVSGPHGCIVSPEGGEGRAGGLRRGHYHLAPLDASPKLPWVAPRLAGMRCYLSLDNLRALSRSMGARELTLLQWYEQGIEDAIRFTAEVAPPPSA
jgi:hypothetical protein